MTSGRAVLMGGDGMDDLAGWSEKAHKFDGITMALAEFLVGIEPGDLSTTIVDTLEKAFVDAIGCGVYGFATPWCERVRRFCLEQGGPSQAGLWASGTKVSAVNTVLATGTAIHSFDFDDHSRAKIHPGAVVVPTLLALGEQFDLSGQDLLVAMAAGYETMNRVSLAANPGRTKSRGWHLTGTAGTFASAAAAAKLLGLNAAQTASALGLAGTQSSGLWAFTADGSMSKRLHAGRAAQAGLVSALMARAGFKGPTKIFEAKDGSFLFAMSDSPRPDRLVQRLGQDWYSDQTCFKPYACCGSNHACVDAALAFTREPEFHLSQVKRIVAGIAEVVNGQTGFVYLADSVLNAQMSLRYNIAVALIDAQASVEQFSEHKIRQADVVALAQRVEIEIDPEIDRNYPEIYGGQVTIEFIDGTKQTRRVDYSLGMPENPVSLESVSNKFRSLVNAVSVDISGEELLGSVLKPFERGSLCPLYAKLRDLKIKPLKVNEF
jgi:2-methylcitrate dehydratase PrpD